jgi:hypothetical protein
MNECSSKAVPRGPPIWIWILVFPKITKDFFFFFFYKKIQITRKPLIGFFPDPKIVGKPRLSLSFLILDSKVGSVVTKVCVVFLL